ncbi:MAG: peptidoglycan bridge formation glycyltransferase FemA/FemB family protein [Propionibacteriaceae bacterium]|nr:peptidoglycan bridge formation glycyltransferase FemA/FemB family protein [Propionibacteriaceae bacterium]
MLRIEILDDQGRWDELVSRSGGHPLQLWGWGELKSAHGPWTATRIQVGDLGGAQVLTRKLPVPFRKLCYVPRGPFVADAGNRREVLDALAGWAKSQGAVELKIEPDWCESDGVDEFRPSGNNVLIPRTIVLDLEQTEEQLLAANSKKTRQYIHKSERAGVTVRRTCDPTDVAAALGIYHETAKRADFALHADSYYHDMNTFLGDASQLYLAEFEGRPLSFLWLATTPSTAFELYGGMNDEGQDLRANYILKWTVICEKRSEGVRSYDLNGLLNDGVSNFKLGFSSTETHFIGTYDRPLSPLYNLWETGLPLGRKALQKLNKLRRG